MHEGGGYFLCVVPGVGQTTIKFFLELDVQGIVYIFLSAIRCGVRPFWNTYPYRVPTVSGGGVNVRGQGRTGRPSWTLRRAGGGPPVTPVTGAACFRPEQGRS